MDRAVRRGEQQHSRGGGVPSCGAHAIPTKIPGDFRSKEVVIFMGARFKLSHLEKEHSFSSPVATTLLSLLLLFDIN